MTARQSEVYVLSVGSVMLTFMRLTFTSSTAFPL